MYYAVIDSASLKNPTILNDFQHRKVTVMYEPESSVGKYHYNFLLEIKNSNIESVISKIQKQLNSGWYSFFWSKSILYIVFNSEKFKIDLPNGWSSDEYKAAQKIGKSQNIPKNYLDFKKYFQPYMHVVEKFKNENIAVKNSMG